MITVDPLKRVKSICNKINLVEFCEQYHNSLAFLDSKYICLKCNPDYYLNQNTCIKRLNSTDNCALYSETQDYCISCKDGFYLNNNKKCDSFPTGIPNCRIYSNQTTCTQCFSGYFLIMNSCELQTPETQIPNCLYYADMKTCSQCERGYYLTSNACVKAIARNCASYLNINQCLTCLPNHGFYKDYNTSAIHCLFISTQNCQIAQNIYPFDCLKCNSLYYLEKGKCFANQTFIPNCIDYNTANTCSKCDSSYILSHDQRSCLGQDVFGLPSLENCVNNQ